MLRPVQKTATTREEFDAALAMTDQITVEGDETLLAYAINDAAGTGWGGPWQDHAHRINPVSHRVLPHHTGRSDTKAVQCLGATATGPEFTRLGVVWEQPHIVVETHTRVLDVVDQSPFAAAARAASSISFP